MCLILSCNTLSLYNYKLLRELFALRDFIYSDIKVSLGADGYTLK